MWIEVVGQVAPVLSAFAATFSAVVALRAARVNKAAQDDLRASRQLSTESELYRHQVAEPLRAYVQVFAEETPRLLAGGFAASDATPTHVLEEAQDRARTLVSELKDRWRSPSIILMAAVEDWDPQMFDELDAELEDVENLISNLVDRRFLAGASVSVPEFDTVIHQHTAKVLRILRNYEPALRGTQPRDTRRALPPPAQTRSIAPPASTSTKRRDSR